MNGTSAPGDARIGWQLVGAYARWIFVAMAALIGFPLSPMVLYSSSVLWRTGFAGKTS
ncbi:MAG: hypothetical protein QOF51_2767 [Chloroflexota bacterium]|jgi:hypothetical protein|nr:hypothetical protein [Chloroflexota bacterium]